MLRRLGGATGSPSALFEHILMSKSSVFRKTMFDNWYDYVRERPSDLIDHCGSSFVKLIINHSSLYEFVCKIFHLLIMYEIRHKVFLLTHRCCLLVRISRDFVVFSAS